MPDGSSLEFFGAGYGTNIVVGPILGRMLSRLPPGLGQPLRRLLKDRTQTSGVRGLLSPELMIQFVWHPAASGQPGPKALVLLADEHGFAAGEPVELDFPFPDFCAPIYFRNYPRRGHYLELQIFSHEASESGNPALRKIGSFPLPESTASAIRPVVA